MSALAFTSENRPTGKRLTATSELQDAKPLKITVQHMGSAFVSVEIEHTRQRDTSLMIVLSAEQWELLSVSLPSRRRTLR